MSMMIGLGEDACVQVCVYVLVSLTRERNVGTLTCTRVTSRVVYECDVEFEVGCMCVRTCDSMCTRVCVCECVSVCMCVVGMWKERGHFNVQFCL